MKALPLLMILSLVASAGCDSYDPDPHAAPSDGGYIGGGGGSSTGDTDTDTDGDSDSDTDADTETETEAECVIFGGYCADTCGYNYYPSEAYGGCDSLEVCCLPYMDDYSCLSLPQDCDEIGADEDVQYFGCCWANTVYWCDPSMGDVVQSEECSSTQSCGYSYEYDGLWCI